MSNWQNIEGIECKTITGRSQKNCIVIFHGYGANAEDLYSLNEYLDPNENYDWYFPDGIIQVKIGPGISGRAWFSIDMQAIEEAMMKGTHRDLSHSRPEDMNQAVEMGLELFKELNKKYNKIIVGGFSQGSMLATEIFFRAEIKPQALVILSGNLVDEETLRLYSSRLSALPYFISHGQMDPILGIKGAEKLHLLLREMGMSGKFYQFQGGHEIPIGILNALKSFLEEHLKD